MSLKVWLPLNGDLRNLGISNIEIINNGATVDNEGKIGKCYYFNNSVYLKESNYDWSNFNTSQFSLCCWYKEPSPVASGNSQIICIGTSRGWNNIRIGLLRRTSNGYPMFSVSNGSSYIGYNFTASNFTFDTWNHIAVTYNNGELKMYLNGSLDKTGSTTIIPVLNSSQHLGIGSASNGVEKLTGYLNDVRIYDHCLSAAEVKEIAQGLVLHYKLDDISNGIQDSSGYNYNLTLTGNLSYDTTTPRYSTSMAFNGATVATAASTGADIRTISCWVKTTKNKSTSQIFVADSGSNMCVSFYKGTIIGVFGTVRSTGSKCALGSSYKENDWNHIVVVKTSDDGMRDIWCNGEKLTPAANDYWSAAAGTWLGARNASLGNPLYGSLSDVRFYCTPLLDTDIKLLYNNGMRIDNLQNIHTFELIENKNKVAITRTGQLYCDSLNETTATKFHKNLIVETTEIIER